MVNEQLFRGMQCSTPLDSGRNWKAAFVSRVLRGAAFVLPNGLGKRSRSMHIRSERPNDADALIIENEVPSCLST